MNAKSALLDELGLLYGEEYRALRASAELFIPHSMPCFPSSLLDQYFDETEEHLLRLEDLFDYLECSHDHAITPTAKAKYPGIVMPGTLFVVERTSRSADPIDAFLLLDHSILSYYRASLSQARAFGRRKVVEVLFQGFHEKVAMQQRFSDRLLTDHDSLYSREVDRMEHPTLLESGGFR
ncbi:MULTISPECIES: hypothetical protein [Terriglobus]|uniref:Ferritin-like metal-binding protein YciE n=1 Tax=Terriglobus roseus TaxID=392734 RepID=A0A1G7HBH6_9BACT|nr:MULTISPECIES: hypothetical protein [Terriglobus]SDE97654.1 Ferritin-like metal-binding protein YciE [Terriglobus roseus]